MQWFEKLLALKFDTAEAQIAAGQVAMEERLWGQARAYLKNAEALEPSAKLYHLLAALEERSGQNEEAAVLWLEKAAEAPPGKAWMCRETGHVYEQWQPVVPPHGAFNTMVWGDPRSNVLKLDRPGRYKAMDGGVLEAPKLAS